MHRIRKILLLLFVVSIVFLSGCDRQKESEFQEISEEELSEEGAQDLEVEEEETKIFVHVCGHVLHPGVYELAMGSRVYEAVEAAGGMKKTAAETSVNQAELLNDGQQLYIPSLEELQMNQEQGGTSSDGKVNINHASKEELMTLSGVGESKAEAIIQYREEQGGFKSIEEIMEIEGIKEGVFRKIEKQITVS